MLKLIIQYVLLSILLMAASIDLYPFIEERQAERFLTLTKQIRCVVCDNQSLAESDMPIAQDIKQFIYQQLLSEQSNESIKQFLIDRYGPRIDYHPPLKFSTYILWFLPYLLMIAGLMGVGFYMWQKNNLKGRL